MNKKYEKDDDYDGNDVGESTICPGVKNSKY